ncbi:Peptidase C1 and/or Propeptide C1 domain containing protein, partial [Asbolus verrucosus]
MVHRLIVHMKLWKEFPNSLMTESSNIWPPSSCDMTPCDFFLRICLKNCIFKMPVHNLEKLRRRIIDSTKHTPELSSDALSDEFINSINAAQSSWRAAKVWPENTTEEFLNGLSGAVDPETYLHEYKHQIDYRPKFRGESHLPDDFDAREKWPKCSSIGTARNQGKCGSCWAVAVASVFTDRYCISMRGKANMNFSAEDIMSCCGELCLAKKEPCRGGRVDSAWKFVKQRGVDKRFITSTYFILSKDVEEIKREIMLNGPVVAHMDVWYDFEAYGGGIYRHTGNSGKRDFKHAVKLIGWGFDTMQGNSYWLGVNSWGPRWGEGGAFKIIRGGDHCGIESAIMTGHVNPHQRYVDNPYRKGAKITTSKPSNSTSSGILPTPSQFVVF